MSSTNIPVFLAMRWICCGRRPVLNNEPSLIGWERIFEGFLADLRQAFTAPSSDPTLTVLVTLIVLVLIAAIALLGFAMYLFATRGRRILFWARTSVSRRDVWIGRALLVVFIVGVFGVLTYYTQDERNCMNCHTATVVRSSLAMTAHKDVQCVSCHMRPGAVGYVQQKVDYARWLSRYLPKREVPDVKMLDGRVDDSACLRCHRVVLRETVKRFNLLVRHRGIPDAGFRCIDCHNQTAHPEVSTPVRRSSMSKCLQCHDGTTESNECATCHPLDVGEGLKEAKREIPKTDVRLAEDWCYGTCHDEETECLVCHGIRMPHPENWAYPHLPVHAAAAAFSKREVCWRCHYPDGKPFADGSIAFCEQCHSTRFHGPNNQVFYSHQRFRTEECVACHPREFCTEWCHENRSPRDPLPAAVRDAPFSIPSDVDY